jgi:UDP-glucose 4-epimerase
MVTGRLSRTALVTGAAGFIGRYVARRLAREGWSVVGIGHGAWAEEERSVHGVAAWHAGDVGPESLQALGDPDLIVHCAGSGSVAASIADPYADFVRTVATCAAVLDFARRRKRPPRIVYPSSPAVCAAAGEGAIAEDAAAAPISPYGEHKRLAEDLCRFHAAQYGIPVAIVRLFSVYGAGLRKQLLWDACTKIASGDPSFSGTGEEVRDWLHVDDAVALLLLAGERAAPACPVVNGGTGVGTANRSVLQALCDRLKPGASPCFSGAARAGDPPRYVADIGEARRWGWSPRRALAEGLADYVRWFREEA